MKILVFYKPTTDAGELASIEAASPVGIFDPGDSHNKWGIVKVTDYPTAWTPPAQNEGETDDDYILRVKPDLLGQFDLNLPNHMLLPNSYYLRLLFRQPEWVAAQDLAHTPT